MKDLISIIVPVYKVENYIHRCVDSILRQTYSNLEIILVDDGSPDRCGEICDDYERQDERIKVIHKTNGGLSDARNKGIENAKGKYITFLDSDDWVDVKYIEKLFHLLNETNSDISACYFIATETENIKLNNSSNYSVYNFSNYEALDQLYTKHSVAMIVAWGKLYKSELFNEIRFPVGKIHEDEFTTYKLIYEANKIALTTEPLLYYWQRPDSIMGTVFNLKNRLHAIDAFQERTEFFKNIGRRDLKDKTFKLLFEMYKFVNENIHMFEDEDSKGKYMDDYKRFKSKLRNSKQSLKFKFYYEIYFISPKLANLIKNINKKIRGTENRIK